MMLTFEQDTTTKWSITGACEFESKEIFSLVEKYKIAPRTWRQEVRRKGSKQETIDAKTCTNT